MGSGLSRAGGWADLSGMAGPRRLPAMFGLGPTELVVILVIALLVLGPQKIPEVATSLGKAIRSFRRATRELREQIDIDEDVRRPFEDLHSALRDEPPPPPRRPALQQPTQQQQPVPQQAPQVAAAPAAPAEPVQAAQPAAAEPPK